MNTRHILVVNVLFAPFSYGGATVVAEEVAHGLMRMGGYRITAVSLCARADLAPYAVIKSQKNDIVNYLINAPEHRKYGEMYNNPEVTARLAELISLLEPDLVHAHCIQEIGTGIIAAAEASHTPVILSVHDFWWICERQFMIGIDDKYCGQSPVIVDDCKGCVDNFWAAKMRFDHLQAISKKASLVTYPSTFAKDLSEASGFAPGIGVVWENGVRLPTDSFFAKQTQRRLRNKKLTFGYLGGPGEIKGWPQIRGAFKEIKQNDFRTLVVDGSLDRSWWKPADFKGLPGEWEIHPRFSQETMDDFYAQIDVLLFMSQWKETFGLAVREALARGIAVIQTDSGGTTSHGATPPDRLIPIGAPPDVLQRQLEDCLNTHPHRRSPFPVTSFDEQARSFAGLVDRVLYDVEKAA